MNEFPVIEIPLPENSPVRLSLPQADFEEAFSKSFEGIPTQTAFQIAQNLFSNPPLLLSFLIGTKNLLLQPFGFSTTHVTNFIFKEMSTDLVLAQFDDKFFSAHLSLFIDRVHRQYVVSNRVHCTNQLGKAYLKLSLPLHKFVARKLINTLP